MQLKTAQYIISQIKCPPYKIAMEYDCRLDALTVGIRYPTKDVFTGEDIQVASVNMIDMMLVKAWDKKALVYYVFKRIQDMAFHELAEWFEVEGEKPYYPHPKQKTDTVKFDIPALEVA